jgi:hypothetical protein
VSVELWDERYRAPDFPAPRYDGWLDRYQNLFNDPRKHLLELGVGLGPNIDHYGSLHRENIHACDFSPTAVAKVSRRYPGVHAFVHDMTETFTYENGAFDLLVSDLSLHYFDLTTTRAIVEEMNRLTTTLGHCIVRVNRVGDERFGYGQGTELEPDYFRLEHNTKRFFTVESLAVLFCAWTPIHLEELTTSKYRTEKQCVLGVFEKGPGESARNPFTPARGNLSP